MDVQNWPTHDPLSRKWPTNLPNPSNQSPHRITQYNNILREFISRWPPDKDRLGGIIAEVPKNPHRAWLGGQVREGVAGVG